MEDIAIIDLYFERSEQAIVETDSKYGGYCYSIAYNILSNREDSQECVSDTYMAAWKSIPPRRPRSLRAFLGKLTRHISVDLWRKSSAKKRGGGEIVLNKQLQLIRGTNGEYKLTPTKNSKVRLVTIAPYVLSILTKVKAEQEQNQILFGRTWNKEGFVFTNPDGEHLRMNTVYKNFKAIVRSLGYDEARFHDLRHSYAVACIKSGDDIKTVQENLGHATASFTLDVYGHVTNRMKQASAARMEQFIHEVAP